MTHRIHASERIEHRVDKPAFLRLLGDYLKPDGLLPDPEEPRPYECDGPRGRIPTSASAWPEPRHVRKMLVLEGCVQPALAPSINAAAARVLNNKLETLEAGSPECIVTVNIACLNHLQSGSRNP